MVSITPQGDIYLCKTPLENDYKNQLTFSNATSQFNYFNSKIFKTLDNYTYIKHDNIIKVGLNIDEIINCNYLFYRNEGFSNKWYYCFITNMEYVNENCTSITFETDVWQTYQFNLTYKQCFVEREHVNNDNIGLHTVPEGLETGDYIVNSVVELGNNQMNVKYIAMAYTSNPEDIFPTITAKEYTGLYSGYHYMILGSPSDADTMIQAFANNGMLEKITCLFTIPTGLIRNSVHWYNGPGATGSDVVEVGGLYPMFALVPSDPVGSHNEITMLSSTNVNINTTINSYTPKNNKLFTSEFNYLYVSNNTGSDIKLNYEDFINNQPAFKISGSISVGCATKLIPLNYKKLDTTAEGMGNSLFTYGVNGSKYPTLAWVGDAYTNWLTQNAINLGTSFVSSGMSVLGSAFTGNPLYAMGGLFDITNKLGQLRQHQLVSDTGQGSLNNGDLTFSSKKMNFTIYRMSIKEEYAKIIDKYFDMFGYKVNIVKLPNITGRTNWNYVKTIDCNVEGDIPQQHLQLIRQMFNNGVTLWHNASHMYDYSQSNNIVS
ncbi:MAG: hypothetical protein J6T10_16505 [Methanobrevibacter sp.]|nr:hypothetical protein [Methanobrevibacter sp.]